jgi:uncharacterized damage-inducible protein DinB
MARTTPPAKPSFLTPAQARDLFGYNARVFDRYVRRLRQMGLRAGRKQRGIGHGSWLGTLVHILNVQEVWIGYILQGKNGEPELEKLFRDTSRHPRDWASFAQYERRVRTQIDDYLRSLQPADLARPVRAPWMPGRYVASDALWQVSFEQAHHLGEIIGSFWEADIEPPEMTWIRVARGTTRS